MTPLSRAILELRLAVTKAEQRALSLERRVAGLERTVHPSAYHPDDLHDHRLAVTGDLADAIDRIEAGLGMRLMQAMHPECDFEGMADVVIDSAAAGAGALS